MWAVLLLAIPFTACTNVVPLPYGQATSAVTMFRPASPSAIAKASSRSPFHDRSISPYDTIPDPEESTPRAQTNDSATTRVRHSPDRYHSIPAIYGGGTSDEDDDIDTSDEYGHDGEGDKGFYETKGKQDLQMDGFGQYRTTGINAHQTLVRRSHDLMKRGTFRGVMQMNCLDASEACQNACYWQNCIKGANGDSTRHTYKLGRRDKKVKEENRVQSGVKVSRGTPCKTWPFGQRFWDSYNFKDGSKQHVVGDRFSYLETDEWPMAAMQNENFDPNADPNIAQHSLRCITGATNGQGGEYLNAFISGFGPYSEKDAKTGQRGIWRDLPLQRARLDPDTELVEGDEFHVEFNFDSFDMSNSTHRKIRKTITYCEPPPTGGDIQCAPDGRQFHMSKMERTKYRLTLNSPYDPTTATAYRVDGEDRDIRQMFVNLDITGDDEETVAAEVQIWENKQYKTLVTRAAATMNDKDSFYLQGANIPDLPKALRVERQGGCNPVFTFTYADPLDPKDANRWFRFKSTVLGYGPFPRGGGSKSKGNDHKEPYCISTPKMKRTQGGTGTKRYGTRLECAFPGW